MIKVFDSLGNCWNIYDLFQTSKIYHFPAKLGSNNVVVIIGYPIIFHSYCKVYEYESLQIAIPIFSE